MRNGEMGYRGEIEEGKVEYFQIKAEEARVEKEGERFITGVEKALATAEGENAKKLRDILEKLNEGEQVERMTIEVAAEALPNIKRSIYHRANAVLEDQEGGRTVVNQGPNINEHYYVPAGVKVMDKDEWSINQGETLPFELGKSKVAKADVKQVVHDAYVADGERPIMANEVLQSVVIDKAIKGWGKTVSGRTLQLDGNRLTLDFSGNPSDNFFRDVLGDAVTTSEDENGERKLVYHEPKVIEGVKMVPVAEVK